MAITASIPLVSGFDLTTNFQTLYTVPAPYVRAVITASVFNNYTTSNATITLRLSQSGTSDTLDEVVTEYEIRAKDNYLMSALIGQALTRGGIIEAKASANSSISSTITGTLIT